MKKKILFTLTIVAVMLFAFAIVSSAATYYVDYDGNVVDETSDNIAYHFEPGGDRTNNGNKCFRIAEIYLHDTSLTKIVFPVASKVKSGYTGIAPQGGWDKSLGVYAKDDTAKANSLSTQIKEVVFLSGADLDGANGKGAFSGFSALEKLSFHGDVSMGGDATNKYGYTSGTAIKQIDFYGSGKINGAFMRHISKDTELTITFHEGCTSQLSTRYYKGGYKYNFPSNSLNNWTLIINPGVTFINLYVNEKDGDSAAPVLFNSDITGLNLIVAVSNLADYEGTDLTTSHGLKYTTDGSVVAATVKTWCELGYHNYEAKECAEICTKCGNAIPLDNPNHNSSVIIEYKDGFAVKGTKTTLCTNTGCTLNTNPDVVEASPLFTFKGYSTDGKEICVGYIINLEAINEYEANNGEAVFKYGFVASANNNTPIDENGVFAEKAINIELTNEKYTAIDFKLVGDWSDSIYATANVTMNLYTILTENGDTAVSYVYGYNDGDVIVSQSYDVADAVSYNDLNPKTEEPQA